MRHGLLVDMRYERIMHLSATMRGGGGGELGGTPGHLHNDL